MSLNLNHPLRHHRFMNPDPGSGGGGGEDRGDDFTPTEDDSGKAKDPEAERIAAEKLQKELDDKAAEKDGKAKAKTDDLDEDDETLTDEEKAAAAAKKKDTRIPLNRHKEILDKERAARVAAEKELEKFQKGQAVADTNKEIADLEAKVTGLEDEYNKLIADGKVAEATKIMRDIRAAERELSETKSDFKIKAAEARAVEITRYGTALDRIEAAYPILNPDHEDFDEKVLAEVVELKEAYQLRGYTPTEALQKAVLKELGAATTTKQKDATSVKPRVNDEDVAEDPDVKAAVAAARKKAALEKTAKTVEKQPASTTKAGLPSDAAGGGLDAKGIMKMSQDDFAKLPEDVLARARGDVI